MFSFILILLNSVSLYKESGDKANSTGQRIAEEVMRWRKKDNYNPPMGLQSRTRPNWILIKNTSMLRDLLTSLFRPPWERDTRGRATPPPCECSPRVFERVVEFQLDVVIIMSDLPARHDGPMVDDPPGPREEIPNTPWARPRGLFLPPSWYQVVSHGVSGLQDEILSTHQNVSRYSFAYIYCIYLSFFLSF